MVRVIILFVAFLDFERGDAVLDIFITAFSSLLPSSYSSVHLDVSCVLCSDIGGRTHRKVQM